MFENLRPIPSPSMSQSSISIFNLQSSIPPSPPPCCEVSNPPTRNNHTFCEQERALGEEVAPVAAQFAAGGNDSVAGDGRIAAVAHDVAHRAVSSRPTGRRCDVTVGGNTAVRNAPDGVEDSRTKVLSSRHGR